MSICIEDVKHLLVSDLTFTNILQRYGTDRILELVSHVSVSGRGRACVRAYPIMCGYLLTSLRSCVILDVV